MKMFSIILNQTPIHMVDVVEITIYHKAHTRANGSFAHGEHDPESISCMSRYAPHMSQILKDHIWAQLSLGYTAK
jgi:hypothetical protein